MISMSKKFKLNFLYLFLITAFILLKQNELSSQWISKEDGRSYNRSLNILSFPHHNFPKQNNFNNNDWVSVQTPSHVYYMTEVFFIDSLFGWACHAGVGIGIVKTTDGGVSWDSVQFGPLGDYLSGIHFIDRYTGWTCGSNGTIRKTTDGGFNWINQDFLFDTRFYSVYFKNDLTGYVSGGNENYRSLLLKTSNGGTNWTRIYTSLTNFSEIEEQYWLNEATAWFGGPYTLLKTTNSGESFIDMYQYVPPPYAVLGIYFLDNNTGWISGNDGSGHNIYKTTNGGFNWVFQDNPASPFAFPQINDIKFISKDTGWTTALVGYILKTTNGGDEWLVDDSSDIEFSELATYHNKKIWCSADFGQIWYLNLRKTTGINSGSSMVNDFHLFQNYPNPFNPSTVIKFDLRNSGFVKLKVYDINGKLVKTLVNEFLRPGTFEIAFDGSSLSSGLYFYLLDYDTKVETKAMVLIK